MSNCCRCRYQQTCLEQLVIVVVIELIWTAVTILVLATNCASILMVVATLKRMMVRFLPEVHGSINVGAKRLVDVLVWLLMVMVLLQ